MLLLSGELLVSVGSSPQLDTYTLGFGDQDHLLQICTKKIVDFAVCSVFYSLLECSGDFEAPHMWDEKEKL